MSFLELPTRISRSLLAAADHRLRLMMSLLQAVAQAVQTASLIQAIAQAVQAGSLIHLIIRSRILTPMTLSRIKIMYLISKKRAMMNMNALNILNPTQPMLLLMKEMKKLLLSKEEREKGVLSAGPEI